MSRIRENGPLRVKGLMKDTYPVLYSTSIFTDSFELIGEFAVFSVHSHSLCIMYTGGRYISSLASRRKTLVEEIVLNRGAPSLILNTILLKSIVTE